MTKKFLAKSPMAVKVHVTLAVFWACMIIPTLLFWAESVLWVAVMSVYALIGSHLAAYQAAASAGVDDATHAKLNAIADALADFLEEAGHEDHANELRSTVGLETQEK